jgi:hypothetical protein
MSVLFDAIYTQTIGASPVASVTFNNIPQGFADLKIIASCRSSRVNNADGVNISFNGITSGFTGRWLESVTASGNVIAGTDTRFTLDIPSANVAANVFGGGEIYIANYSSAFYKQIWSESASPATTAIGYTCITAQTWLNSSAITSITLTPANGNFIQNSTFTLYGLGKLNSFPKALGGAISYDGRFYYHVYKNTGTFSFNAKEDMSANIYMIGGGGGGGSGTGGGGGAGGYHEVSGNFKGGKSYQVVVGGGGTGGIDRGAGGGGGSSSVVTEDWSYVASGGGGGGSQNSLAGNGGCGGGGSGGTNTGPNARGTGGVVGNAYGFDGGFGTQVNSSGGGGGISQIGGISGSTISGNGGNGLFLNPSISRLLDGQTQFGGGGGGGAYELGTRGIGSYGGGNGGTPGTASAGAGANGTTWGSGGGGSGGSGGSYSFSFNTGGSGYQGFVVIKYADRV